VLDPSLLGLLPFVVAFLPASRPLPGWFFVDAAPLVALSLVDRLPEPCPTGMVLVDGGFCPMLKYQCEMGERGDWSRCGEYARGSSCPTLLEPRRYCIDRYEWPNLVGENPRVYVSFYQAKELCWTVGKRLCRRSEWMLACEGPKRLPYPYGYARKPTPCNIDRISVPFDFAAMLDPRTRDEELSRLWQADPIGSHPACVSAWGAYDMVGNVDEWTDNQADDPGTSYVSTLNGGYWGPVRDTCRLTTRAHEPTFRFYQVGFRCCSDALDGIESPPIVLHQGGIPE
jgi:formylglycine-generating enzyme